MAFTKLDSGITDSTIWQAPDSTRIVWITMLAMADKNGYIGASMPGLAGRARVSLEACIAAVSTFMAPDEWSRTQEFEGRRIAEAEGGWVLLNHAKYRAAEDADKRRERSRIAMQKLRAKRAAALTVNQVDVSDGRLPQADTDTEADTEAREKPLAPSSTNSAPVLRFATNGDPKSWSLTERKLAEYADTFDGIDVLAECKKALQWTRDNHFKTARGMPKFLNGWLCKAVNGQRSNGNGHSRSDIAHTARTSGRSTHPDDLAADERISYRNPS